MRACVAAMCDPPLIVRGQAAKWSASRSTGALNFMSTTANLPFETRLARAKFRAWHRGTREADYTFGGFFDAYGAEWDEPQLAWFEALLDEDDVDVMAWAMRVSEPPPALAGPLMEQMRLLDYVKIG